ncbi:FecR family protein [Methylobacillus rhizosphaerae]|uniref:FecR family protein n=1 Tax=Methylobacillus rhizosphaerae TaxID=551994 RepID=A0A238ZZ94_9PROT|nr:FecR domain-containing protein [Methylobacillus rhizosphaerae]SNR88715.1 FecR family protein [Methylobacillus rhizosphaerae]
MNILRNHGTPWQLHHRQSAMVLGLVLATYAPVRAETINHTVVHGDNLYNLAAHYMGNAQSWPDIQKLNHIPNPHYLLPGTSLLIPKISSTVTASFVRGEVSLIDETGNSIRTVAYGDQLAEGDIVRTGENSYLSLEFSDKSVGRILSNTRARLDRIKEGNLVRKNQRVIYLEYGDIDVSVIPALQSKHPPQYFKVITPYAVAAARGTRFRVSAGDISTTSVTHSQVDMRWAKAVKRHPNKTLHAGQGVAIDDHGLGTIQSLLPAPDLSQLPSKFSEPEILQFNWPALDNSKKYQYRIAQDENLEQVLWDTASDSAQAVLPSLQDGEYLLAVRALDPLGIAGYEAQHRFTIFSHPSSPWLLAPQQGQTVTRNSTLRCTPVENAHGYRMQIASDPDFQHLVTDADKLEHCKYQLESLAYGQYYWRIASIMADSDGKLHYGPYSQPATIIISENGTSASPSSGQAYWNSRQQDIHYLAQVSRTPQFDSLVIEQVLDNTSLNIQSLPAGRYYVRLATMVENNTGPFSDARIIEVDHDIDRTWFDKRKP